MNAEVRGKLDMADRVQVFSRTHPVEDPGLQAVFDQVDESITRAQALIKQQSEGAQRARASTARRVELRDQLWVGLLRLIANVCRAGAREDPSLSSMRPPRRRAVNRVFITEAEALVNGARQHLDRLAKHGLTAGLLDEASKMVTEYRTVTETAHSARQARVEAGAELDKVAAVIMDLVVRVDGLNRHRFAHLPEILAGWESARNLVTSASRAPSVVPPAGPAADLPAAA